MFSDEVRITVLEAEKKVSVSIRLNETTVIVKTISVADFKVQLAQLREVLERV